MLYEVGLIVLQSYAAFLCMLALVLLPLATGRRQAACVTCAQTVLLLSAAVHTWTAYRVVGGGPSLADASLEARVAKRLISLCGHT